MSDRRAFLRGLASLPIGAADVTSAMARAGAASDAELIGLANEHRAASHGALALIAACPGVDCHQIPGYLAEQDRYFDLSHRIAAVPAKGRQGILAKANTLLICRDEDDGEMVP